MKLYFSKEELPDPETAIRRSGYGKLVDRRTRETSFVRRIHGDLYPRFHVYILDKENEIIFNLHLDQRPTRYEGVTAHSGEYEGEVVEKEAKRIKETIKNIRP